MPKNSARRRLPDASRPPTSTSTNKNHRTTVGSDGGDGSPIPTRIKGTPRRTAKHIINDSEEDNNESEEDDHDSEDGDIRKISGSKTNDVIDNGDNSNKVSNGNCFFSSQVSRPSPFMQSIPDSDEATVQEKRKRKATSKLAQTCMSHTGYDIPAKCTLTR